MKKNKFLAIMLSLLIGVAAFVSGGCNIGGKQRIDYGNRLPLKVFSYNGGIGSNWLTDVIARFEEANKDRQFESGKVGVVIDWTPGGQNIEDLSVLGTKEETVFFNQNVNYITQRAGTFQDISDLVTGSNPYETDKTIESKLSDDMQDALTALDGNYYVLPHFQAYSGVMYNKNVFDDNMLYFARYEEDYRSSDPNNAAYGFIYDDDCEKSCGPDGVFDTEDDGLPSSVDEFIALVKYIRKTDVVPFAFYGAGYSYQQKLYDALWVNIEGYDGAMAQFTFDSKGKTSSIVTGFDGDVPITEDVVITEENAYLVYQQESKYHALRAAEFVFKDDKNYHEKSMSSSGVDKIQELLLSGEVAMLLEGTYWLNEATDANVLGRNPKYKNQDVRFMPLPVQGYGKVTEGNGKPRTVMNIHGAYSFINGNTESKYGAETLQIAKEFLQFCSTDESLQAFTVKSSTTREIKYELSPENYDKLTKFAKSVWDLRKDDPENPGVQHVVNDISGNPIFVRYPRYFNMCAPQIWASGGTPENPAEYHPAYAFKKGSSATAKSYFLGMQKTQAWWDSLRNSVGG